MAISQEEMDFIAEGFSEVYKTMGRPMTYYKLNPTLTQRDKFGKITPSYATPISLYGVLESKEFVDVDLINGIPRHDAKILVSIKDVGSQPKLKDVIDVTLDGVTSRYVVVGFDKNVDFIDYFNKLLVALEETVMQNGI